LYTVEEVVIAAGSAGLVPTGLKMAIPEGLYGRIAPRSGFSLSTGLIVNAGVIDCDYRGEVKIMFHNFNELPVKIFKGTKVAQLILEKIAMFPVQEVSDLDATERGENGFGSTGLF
jgi:dUTP pyrophosphatase